MENSHKTAYEIIGYCRDCLSKLYQQIAGSLSCPYCQSQRVLKHKEIEELSIAHIDCDAFFAAVEKRDRPDLADKPVIVGGGKRGVVSTCCYIARLYGVRSAMPMFKALKLCPDAVVINPKHGRYSEVSKEVFALMRKLTPLVQQVSVDEAYIDLAGTETLHGASPAELLLKLQNQIEAEQRLTVSVGLAPNKYLAKMASEMDKPRGFSVIGNSDKQEILAPLSVRKINGIGPALAKKLTKAGLHSIGDLQRFTQEALIEKYGDTGDWLFRRAHGIDNRRVNTERERKSVSSETTFFEDVSDIQMLSDILWKLAIKTADRAKKASVEGRVVTVKLKTAAFKTVTRRATLNAPTQLAQPIFRVGRAMLAKEVDGKKFRLIGIGISDLIDISDSAPTDSVDLIDARVEKRAKAERASDIARAKFGPDAVKTGRAIRLDNRKNRD